jgi:MFS family permease
VFVLLGLICSIFVVNKPQDLGQHMDGLSPEDIEKALQAGKAKSKIHKTSQVWSIKETLRTRTLWIYVVVVTGHLMALTFIATHGILNFLDRGFSPKEAPMIFSMVLLGSALIRFPIGMLGDKIEPRHIINASFGIMMVMLFFIWKNQSLPMIMFAGFLFGACYGTQLIMFPTLMGNYYGPEVFAGIAGALSPAFVIFGAVVPVGGGYIFEAAGSYDPAYIFLVCLLVVAFAFSFFLSPPAKHSAS